jgi:aspartyl-tRNA(Asn)/glutamyl-tRNA(Gln) amidotransferase subunit A
MTPGDGELQTAAEMAAALRAGEVTSVELVERSLARAEAWQPSINAFSQLWPEEALAEARRIDAADPRARPPFAGVPIAIKDLFDVAGHETTGCCAAYRGRVADADAPLVARLRTAGLVMIGKTNQHELAAGGTNLVSACGRTGNPWDSSRITGGSSGGSGAAVAAGIVPWALGSDTGGSIRIPAALCGCFGLKPTQGRWQLEGVMPLAPSMDCPGPMAADASDLAALAAIGDPGADGREPPGRFRIGLPDGFFRDLVHLEVLAAVDAVSRDLQGFGANIDAVDGTGLSEVRSIWTGICYPEFAEAHPKLRGPALDLVSDQPRRWLERGMADTSDQRAEAARRREEVGAWFRRALEGQDALLIPTTVYPAFAWDATSVDVGDGGSVDPDDVGPGWLTSSVNLAGLPAVNLPAARSSDGVPIGVSLVGRVGDDVALVALAVRWAAHRDRSPLPSIPA